ncbi:MAG: T9SS type A sorting domain-containing protein [Bacteroidota bacterium]
MIPSVLLLIPSLFYSQTNFIISSGDVVQSAGFIVLDDTDFINDGSFTAGSGTVEMTGMLNSTIGGTIVPIFNELIIRKTSNNVLLAQSVMIDRGLTLAGGLLDVQNSNLSLQNTAISVTGAQADRYIKTSSTGVLVIEVGTGAVFFPVGNSSYNPATLTNSGTIDDFQIRVADEVLADGTSGTPFTDELVDRTWFIDESIVGGSNVNLSLQWNASEELGSFSRATAFISRYNGTAWDTNPPSTVLGSDPYTISRNGITDFSPFTIGSGNFVAVPVELLFFRATATNNRTLLEWTTTSELNNAGFQIERSDAAEGWSAIGFVNGMGTTVQRQDYSFWDESPASGLNYYRLKQIDLDGSFTYSPIEVVEFSSSQLSLSYVYPNPSDGIAYMDLSLPGQDQIYIDIFDASGKIVQKEKQVLSAGINSIILRPSNLSPGIYYIKISIQDLQFERKMIVK